MARRECGQIVGTPPSDWRVIGSGDFNGDGLSDILWQDNNGDAAIWLMNGISVVSQQILATRFPDWRAIGTGNFTRDRDSGIVCQDSDGAVAIWGTNGTTPTSEQIIATPTPDWQVIGTGDFFGQGQSDIIRRNGAFFQLVLPIKTKDRERGGVCAQA